MMHIREEIESIIERNHPEVGGWVAPRIPKLTVLAQAGTFHCGECGQPLRFEPCVLSEANPEGIGRCSNEATYSNVTGELLSKGCSRANIKLKVPLSVLHCDVVD